jgi:hypothetical protein
VKRLSKAARASRPGSAVGRARGRPCGAVLARESSAGTRRASFGSARAERRSSSRVRVWQPRLVLVHAGVGPARRGVRRDLRPIRPGFHLVRRRPGVSRRRSRPIYRSDEPLRRAHGLDRRRSVQRAAHPRPIRRHFQLRRRRDELCARSSHPSFSRPRLPRRDSELSEHDDEPREKRNELRENRNGPRCRDDELRCVRWQRNDFTPDGSVLHILK